MNKPPQGWVILTREMTATALHRFAERAGNEPIIRKLIEQSEQQMKNEYAPNSSFCFVSVVCVVCVTVAVVVAGSPKRERMASLAAVLETMQKPGTQRANPGYYDPLARKTLKQFIEKHSGTEEALYAQVWLEFAEAVTQDSRDPVLRGNARKLRAQRMQSIAGMSTNRTTINAARLVRTSELFNLQDWENFKVQTDEILSHITDRSGQTNELYLKFMKSFEVLPQDVEPWLRSLLVVMECYQGRETEALQIAIELQREFPNWCNREGFDADVKMLRNGRSPFAKMPPR